MFQLDDNFLNDVGLGALPDDQKQAFLQHIFEELELRVGTKLSEGLNEDQMGQFEAFVDQDEQKVRMWFEKNIPDYASRQDFVQMKQAAPQEASELSLMCEYGSLRWLEINRPDYRSVVAEELEKLKKEISANAPTILGQDEKDESTQTA